MEVLTWMGRPGIRRAAPCRRGDDDAMIGVASSRRPVDIADRVPPWWARTRPVGTRSRSLASPAAVKPDRTRSMAGVSSTPELIFVRRDEKTPCVNRRRRYSWEFHGLLLAGVAQSAELRFCKPAVVSSTLTASSVGRETTPGRDGGDGRRTPGANAPRIGPRRRRRISRVDTQAAKGARL
jgi:hypothetical protein